MRKFTSTNNISVNEVLQLLNDWENDKLSRDDILYIAEGIDELYPNGWPSYPQTDSRSILFGVLDLLITLHTQPILKEDLPHIRRFLTNGQTQPTKAWETMDTYWDSINRIKRLHDLYGYESK